MFPKGLFKPEVYDAFEGAIFLDGTDFKSLNRQQQDSVIIGFFYRGGVISVGDGE